MADADVLGCSSCTLWAVCPHLYAETLEVEVGDTLELLGDVLSWDGSTAVSVDHALSKGSRAFF